MEVEKKTGKKAGKEFDKELHDITQRLPRLRQLDRLIRLNAVWLAVNADIIARWWKTLPDSLRLILAQPAKIRNRCIDDNPNLLKKGLIIGAKRNSRATLGHSGSNNGKTNYLRAQRELDAAFARVQAMEAEMINLRHVLADIIPGANLVDDPVTKIAAAIRRESKDPVQFAQRLKSFAATVLPMKKRAA